LPFCPNCGKPYTEGAAFCPSCGRPLQGANPAAPPTANVQPQPGAPPMARPTGVTILGALQIVGSVIEIGAGLILGIFGLFVLVLGILTLLFALALLAGRNWARILMLVAGVLDIISIVGIIWGAILLYYFTRPHVVAYFNGPKRPLGV
jgi:hypothetical protein